MNIDKIPYFLVYKNGKMVWDKDGILSPRKAHQTAAITNMKRKSFLRNSALILGAGLLPELADAVREAKSQSALRILPISAAQTRCDTRSRYGCCAPSPAIA